MEAPEDAAAQTAGTGGGAGSRRLARARGARPQRAARARHQGRRDLRDRPAAAARRGGAGAGCARSPRVGSARRPPTALLAAVNAALAMPKEEMPRLPKPPQHPEGSSAASELLKVLLRLVAEKEGVAAKVLASCDDIDRIAADGEEAEVAGPASAGGAKCSASARSSWCAARSRSSSNNRKIVAGGIAGAPAARSFRS